MILVWSTLMVLTLNMVHLDALMDIIFMVWSYLILRVCVRCFVRVQRRFNEVWYYASLAFHMWCPTTLMMIKCSLINNVTHLLRDVDLKDDFAPFMRPSLSLKAFNVANPG